MLRPIYRDTSHLDGTISDKLFVRGPVLGSGGFSKVYLCKYPVI